MFLQLICFLSRNLNNLNGLFPGLFFFSFFPNALKMYLQPAYQSRLLHCWRILRKYLHILKHDASSALLYRKWYCDLFGCDAEPSVDWEKYFRKLQHLRGISCSWVTVSSKSDIPEEFCAVKLILLLKLLLNCISVNFMKLFLCLCMQGTIIWIKFPDVLFILWGGVSVFVWDLPRVLLLPPTVLRYSRLVNWGFWTGCRCECGCDWLFASCDGLATCSGCITMLARWQLG